VPQLHVAVAIAFNLLCIGLFFQFVHALARSLRPVSVLLRVATEARGVIESVYPDRFDPNHTSPAAKDRTHTNERLVECARPLGVVLAFSSADLIRLAGESDAMIQLLPQVGDFIARGDPLFRVIGEKRPVSDAALHQCVAIGPERTLEQDPRFAFRIIVDIAIKALSPAINDPTTAVLALDQLHRLLQGVGRRRLDDVETRDSNGEVRLLYGTPDWSDYVTLALCEIRHYGATSMQVVRRMRALLLHLMQVLPEARHAALQRELKLLDGAVQRAFQDAEDRAVAGIADLQGTGGSCATLPAMEAQFEKRI
jgi:uncharacterized membrane protein